MLRNYTERLASALEFPAQTRKFLEDTLRSVSQAPRGRVPLPKIQGRSNTSILDELDRHDPITRGGDNLDELMDVYVDRTYRTWLDIANPTPDVARGQVAGLIEGIAGATRVVRELGNSWTNDKEFAQALMTGSAVEPLAHQLTQEEAASTGLTGIQNSVDPTGTTLQRWAESKGSDGGLRISDASALRLSKKVWPLWESIGSLSESEPRISVPDFSTNPGTFKKSKLTAISTDKSFAERLAGRLQQKGKQMANKARAPQGKQVRKMIVLADALGIFGGSLINNPAYRDRDDNLGKHLHTSGGPRQFPRGAYAVPGTLEKITGLLLEAERGGTISKQGVLKKYSTGQDYTVTILKSAGPLSSRQIFEDPSWAPKPLPTDLVPKNFDQLRRKNRGRSESFDPVRSGEISVKRQRPDPRKARPTGTAASDRLRVSGTTVVSDTRVKNAGALLKNVRPTNPTSILDANESLTSTGVPKSNIFDPVAAGVQSHLVRNQLRSTPDDRAHLRSSCLQQANIKSAAELARLVEELGTMTSRANDLSQRLVSERTISTQKIEVIQGDNDALKENLLTAQHKYRETLDEVKRVKGTYDSETHKWMSLKAKHKELLAKMGTLKTETATAAIQQKHGVQVLQEQLRVMRSQEEKFGVQKQSYEHALETKQDQLEVKTREIERVTQDAQSAIREMEAQMGRYKDENYRLSEKQEMVVSDQMMLRRQLEQAHQTTGQMRQQLVRIGRVNEEKDRNIMDLTQQIRDMEAKMGVDRAQVIHKDLELLARGMDAKVLTSQFERQLGISGELEFRNQDLERQLSTAEDEVIASRSTCPRKIIEDEEMGDVEVANADRGREGGGFGGEGGAAMRAKPDWMKPYEPGVTDSYGDSDFGDVPPYTVEDSAPDSGPLYFALLLLLVVGIYVAYR